MKFVARVLDERILLTLEDFTLLTNIMRRSERLGEEHVGKGKGSSGYDLAYVPKIDPPTTELLRCETIDDDTYSAYKVMTAIRTNKED